MLPLLSPLYSLEDVFLFFGILFYLSRDWYTY